MSISSVNDTDHQNNSTSESYSNSSDDDSESDDDTSSTAFSYYPRAASSPRRARHAVSTADKPNKPLTGVPESSEVPSASSVCKRGVGRNAARRRAKAPSYLEQFKLMMESNARAAQQRQKDWDKMREREKTFAIMSMDCSQMSPDSKQYWSEKRRVIRVSSYRRRRLFKGDDGSPSLPPGGLC